MWPSRSAVPSAASVFPIILAAVVTAYGNAGYGLGFLVFTLFAIANIVLNWLGMMRKAN